ncbi:MAG: ferredoxin [Bacteroidales bacterium]|jgi:uncharacterized ferredoxin-like protein|nr:DUF2148 domain-containing protein [Bacteroidales bacterium]MCK9500146.1 DUF2148 domain-containing protein [Bacteroidales bacterium]MDY0315282.1 DUF2148 domain-containing protein [Bacteroidales bacterium]NLB86104.1 ferredoxin [Bacteroidales bacterium]
MILDKNSLTNSVVDLAKNIGIAIQTAPKGKGRDTLDFRIVSGKEDLEKIALKMEEISEKSGQKFFLRDANNLRESDAVIILATYIESLGLRNCGYCGKETCDNKNNFPDVPCAFNTIDLGIAIGSAVSKAADYRIDNRVMFSVGNAAKEMAMFDEKYKVIFAITLSASASNIYFDRKSHNPKP